LGEKKKYGEHGWEGLVEAYHESEWKGACDDGASMEELA
jgi:hypothetical protein